MSRHRKLTAALAVVPLLFGACGGSSSGPAGGASAASWCDFADESDVVDEIFSSLGADASDLEAGITQVESFVKRLPDEAPDEIKEPAKKLAEGTQMLVDAIKAADYNILDADLSFLENSTLDAELEAASDELDAYTETACGRSFSGGDETDTDTGVAGDDTVDTSDDAVDDSGDFNPGDGTIREQLVAQFVSIGLAQQEAECIADKLDFGDPAVQSGDIGAMLGVFEECGIGLDRLAELGGG
ncbi:MAG: hypothetical protein ACI9N0_001001 [Ilumatobacter sp.]|jgi:hypothetical protein